MQYLIRSRHRAFKEGFEYAIVDRKPEGRRETLDYDVTVFTIPLEDCTLRSAITLCEAGCLKEA